MSYSQFDEESFIEAFFAGQTGRFLDIGAFDGIHLSNTRRLLEIGWSGVLVEPVGANFVKLMANNAPYVDRTVLVQAAVSGDDKLAEFWMDREPGREWATTMSEDHRSEVSIDTNPHRVFIPSVMPRAFQPLGPFDFISIDAEWMDYEIALRTPDPMLKACKLVCIETQNDRSAMIELFRTRGFYPVHFTPPNVFFAR